MPSNSVYTPSLWKLYALTAIQNFFITMPILIPFLEHHGLTLFEIFVVQSVYAATLVVSEIPTGYISDRFGRRSSFILFGILFVLGTLSYAVFRSFEAFLIAEILLGLSASFMSGTNSAFLFETLAQRKQENQYRKKEGTLELIGRFSYAIAAIAGGVLAAISLDWPFWTRFGVALLALPIVFSLPKTIPTARQPWRRYVQEIQETIQFSLVKNKAVRSLIVYSGLSGCVIGAVVLLFQPYFQLVGVPLVWFGVLWAMYNLMTGIGAQFSDELEFLVGQKRLLWILSIGTAISLFVFGWFIGLWVLLFGLAIQMFRGIRRVVVKHYFNQHIDASKRATVLSIDSMISELLFVIIAPVIGWIADSQGVQTSFWILGVFVIMTAVATVPMVHRHIWTKQT